MTTLARPRVLVTRPAHQAAEWVSAFRQRGIEAQCLPLVATRAVDRSTELHDVLVDWHHSVVQPLSGAAGQPRLRALMFVSPEAVRYAGQAWNAEQSLWPELLAAQERAQSDARNASHRPRLWATGPGTGKALQVLGLGSCWIDRPDDREGRFDSEALWKQVSHQVVAGDRVWIVRGGVRSGAVLGAQGRDWLADRLREVGALVRFCIAYERCPPEWSAGQHALARQALSDGSIWLLTSSQGVRHLRDAVGDGPWPQARAIASHPRVADAAASLGMGRVVVGGAQLSSIMASIESFE